MSDILLAGGSTGSRGFFNRGPTGISNLGIALLTLIIFATIEDVASRYQFINSNKFPPAGDVFIESTRLIMKGELISILLTTFSHWGISLLIALAIAFVLGVSIGMSQVLQHILLPIIEFIRPVPSTALIPLSILAIGANPQGVIFLTVFGTLWQLLPLFISATRSLDPVKKEVAYAFGISAINFFLFVRLPSLWPTVKTSLRIGGAAALVLLISMEYLAGIDGIGKEVAVAYTGSNYLRMYSCIWIVLVFSVVLNHLLAIWNPAKGEYQ